jgi:hypothetical protein
MIEPLEGRVLLSDVSVFQLAPASLSGRLFQTNAGLNGLSTRGGRPIAGATVFADRNGNRRLDPGEESAVTDAEGRYTFDDLAFGTVQIRVDGRSGWSEYTVDPELVIQPGQAHSQDVYLYRSRTIRGVLFRDNDFDGVRDLGERPLAGIRIWVVLTGSDDGPIFLETWRTLDNLLDLRDRTTTPHRLSVITSPDGSFVLPDLGLIEQRIIIETGNGWSLSTDNSMGNDLIIGLLPTAKIPPPRAKVKGRVFADPNRNGLVDPGEKPVKGAHIVVTRDGTPLYTATSNRKGAYQIPLPQWGGLLEIAAYRFKNGPLIGPTIDFGVSRHESKTMHLSLIRNTGSVLIPVSRGHR